ncbi:MAG: hypothetical protein WDM84_01690 [Bauldia sp.]
MADEVVFRAGEGPFRQIRPDLAGVLIGGDEVTLVRWEFRSEDRPPAFTHTPATSNSASCWAEP